MEGVRREGGRLPGWVRPAVKLVLAVVVLGFAGRHVAGIVAHLAAGGVRPRLAPGWFGAAGLLYLAALVVDGVWFGRVLRQGPAPVGFVPAVRAYLISHLAKYVPGKAMVVVVRVGLVAPAGATVAAATFATFYETLTMMAAGGLVAAVGLAGGGAVVPVAGLGPLPLWLVGLAFGLLYLGVTAPAVFPRLAGAASRLVRGAGRAELPPVSPALWAEGLAWTTLGWLLMGASQVAVLAGLGLAVAPGRGLQVVGAVALATVAGFAVAVAPGGLGVREWVLWTSLGPALDHEWAVVAALALRLVWVATEIVGAALVAPLGARGRRDATNDRGAR